MSDMRFSKLSEAELNEIHEAERQIIQAERVIADVVLKHLHKSAKDVSVIRSAELRVVRCGLSPCGVYVDPPGICAPI